MITYIAFLRGINVGGHKKIKMTDLRKMFQKTHFEDVQTYIQSGNIVFTSVDSDVQFLQEKIRKAMVKTFDFDVPVLVKTRIDLIKILNKSPYTESEDIEANKVYYVLLKNEPEQANFENINQKDYPNELFSITKNCVYLNCTNGAGKAKLNNNIIEQKLKVSATTRNHRTIMKLLELSQEK